MNKGFLLVFCLMFSGLIFSQEFKFEKEIKNTTNKVPKVFIITFLHGKINVNNLF